MRVRVDPEKCQGHVRCIQAVPEIFQEDEQGHSFTLDEDVPVELQLRVRQAERNCPEQAINVTE
jgi:ferredoxin